MDARKPGSRPPQGLSEGFYDALGHTIKVARTDLRIDRKDLAERAGISYSYLAAIENGQKQPSPHVLLAVADALGLRTHELMESAESRQDRNIGATEDYPAWLAGPAGRGRVGRIETPMAASASIADADAYMETEPSPPPELANTDAYIEELVGLAASVPVRDRQLLIDLAMKLADPQ